MLCHRCSYLIPGVIPKWNLLNVDTAGSSPDVHISWLSLIPVLPYIYNTHLCVCVCVCACMCVCVYLYLSINKISLIYLSIFLSLFLSAPVVNISEMLPPSSVNSGVSNCRDRALKTCDKPNSLSTVKVVKISARLANRCRHLVINLIICMCTML